MRNYDWSTLDIGKKLKMRLGLQWLYAKVTVSSCAITTVKTQNTLISP